ncbi:hypothetical protein [Shewanella holmiensis]|uniref:Uncharacterized protein n=1 Tax=Shewanella holmiensis TaxID=2952222 RepID=A0A9X2WNZ9_9GAMM|nr:hypothetical protein [Shewanella holmiensis]MCT7942402.1 hypothetical protein [Shewanella holmiensis]
MGILNDDVPTTSIQVESRAEAKFSRSTIAHIETSKEQLVNTRKSMLDDMSKGQFTTPQDALDAIMELQSIQGNLDKLSDKIKNNTTSSFSPSDVATMREMKSNGTTEAKIAELFDTNQTKVNRLLNK